MGESNSPVTAITIAIAEAEGLDVTDMPVLADKIDPDALESLFDDVNGKTVDAVSFGFSGYKVALYGDGLLEIKSLASNPS